MVESWVAQVWAGVSAVLALCYALSGVQYWRLYKKALRLKRRVIELEKK